MRRIILFMFVFFFSTPSIHSHNWSLELFFGTLTNVLRMLRASDAIMKGFACVWLRVLERGLLR